MSINIKIDASSDFLYSSYYIYGFEKYIGGKNIKYSNKEFSKFEHNNKFFAAIIYKEHIPKKLIIDFGDSEKIDMLAYDWSDIYAKINIKLDEDENLNKLISIGPSFGVKFKSIFSTLILLFTNLLKSRKRIQNKKKFISDYINTYIHRVKINSYENKKLIENKIFFLASIWKKETSTNTYRKNFIEACLNYQNIRFEGGFAPRNDNNNLEFEKYIDKKYKLKEYINNIKGSKLVFNTPAVFSCHGWKLAEFCVLGKAIISTPLSRKMPGHFSENEHYILTDGSEVDLKNKINLVINNDDLRQKLQNNVLKYYEEFLEPTKVAEILINQLFKD